MFGKYKKLEDYYSKWKQWPHCTLNYHLFSCRELNLNE